MLHWRIPLFVVIYLFTIFRENKSLQNVRSSLLNARFQRVNSRRWLLAASATQSTPAVTTDRKTFKRFVQIELWRNPDLGSIYPIMYNIEQSCRDINRLMRRISTDQLDGNHYEESQSGASVNIQGENQKKLDVLANNILKVSLCCTGKVSMIASEEDETGCLCSEVTHNSAFAAGDYVVVFDPLDGSSNIDSGLPTGTIFGIYKKSSYGPSDPLAIALQKGSELVAAGYCLYAAATHLVVTMRSGLHMFTLDDVSGEFYLTKSNIRIPRHGNIYSFNDAYLESWHVSCQNFIEDFRANRIVGSTVHRKPTARYMGALVADVHNILLNGGIYGYPATQGNPQGKLRLLYEANPLAMVLEEAGGMASDGQERILDLPVHDIHQRTPLFLGSLDEIRALERYVSFYSKQNGIHPCM